jgi:cell wall-associated NlpC family hydrolase
MLATVQATRAAHYPGPAPAAAMRAAPVPPFPRTSFPRIALAAVLAAACLLAGCGRDDVRPTRPQAATRDWPQAPPADPAAANAVLMRAISLVGTPYRYGGDSPEGGFDCSGLVHYVFRDMLDLRLPRTSRALAEYQGPRIPPERLATADLVFFGRGGSVTHVGIYVGEGRFVHAPTSGGTVRLDHLDGPYWRDHYSGARRVLR